MVDLRIDLGGRTVELRHLARGNTKGDMLMWLPEERILATGDIVVAPTPYGFFSYPKSWAGVLRELKSFGARTIVPGHGDVMTDTAYLDLLAETMDLVASQVDAQARAGKSLEETRAAMDWSAVEPRFTGGDPRQALVARQLQAEVAAVRGEFQRGGGARAGNRRSQILDVLWYEASCRAARAGPCAGGEQKHRAARCKSK